MKPRVLLLYPPLADPTSGHHGLVHIGSEARARGFEDVSIRDLNIEALNYCARPDVMQDLLQDWADRRQLLEGQESLTRREQLEYAHLLRASHMTSVDAQTAIDVLRSPVAFFDYNRYCDAVHTLLLWVRALACSDCPGQNDGFSVATKGSVGLSSLHDMSDFNTLQRIVGPLAEGIESGLLLDVVATPPDVIGINITYAGQLPHALWLLRRIRERVPQAYLVVGGTEVTRIWKDVDDRRKLAALYSGADACVVGEGETAFVEILESIAMGRPPGHGTNRLDLHDLTEQSASPTIKTEDLDALASPDYSLLDLEQYWSPHNFVYYSPSRGCYWDRCAFCQNGSSATGWRQRSDERILADLRQISDHSRYVYLAVDALSPSALLRLATRLVEARLPLCWSTEVRLEKGFSQIHCDVLHESGCRAISVRFDSGSQATLDRFDKGMKLHAISRSIDSFTKAGIAVQMMGTTGFPGETRDEAMDTITYLLDRRAGWTMAEVDRFVLRSGSRMAQMPAKYGIETRPATGADMYPFRGYQERSPARTAEQDAEVDRARQQLRGQGLDRPFAGGIDTPHSLFYHDRHGIGFPAHVQTAAPSEDTPIVLRGTLLPHVPFEVTRLFDEAALSAFHDAEVQKGRVADSRSLDDLLDGEAGRLHRLEKVSNPCFARLDGLLLPCPEDLLAVLLSIHQGTTLRRLRDVLSQRPGGGRPLESLQHALDLGLVGAAERRGVLVGH